MRKSTLVVMAILCAALVVLTMSMKLYTDQFLEEISHAKDLTKEFKDELEPESRVKLARVMGSSKYLVEDTKTPGLLLEASPSEASWKKDPSGWGLAQRMALRLFDAYPPDRPIRWVQFRLAHADGTRVPEFGLARGEGEALMPIQPKKK